MSLYSVSVVTKYMPLCCRSSFVW